MIKRILICDDDFITHKAIDRSLSNINNIRITSVFTGVEAIQQIKHKHFDFIFVDNFLGSLMGTEVINAVKGIINGTKVYLITGVTEKALSDVEKSGAKVHGIIDKANLSDEIAKLLSLESA